MFKYANPEGFDFMLEDYQVQFLSHLQQSTDCYNIDSTAKVNIAPSERKQNDFYNWTIWFIQGREQFVYIHMIWGGKMIQAHVLETKLHTTKV